MESKTSLPTPLLLARYRLRQQGLVRQKVAVLEFPWAQAFDTFIQGFLQAEGKKELDYDKRPPYQLINMALTTLAPPLVHGFEHVKKDQPRQMLALADDLTQHPSIDQILSTVEPWGRQWVLRAFQPFVEGRGRDAFRRFQEQLNTPQGIWQEVSADSLWSNLRYRAIPSLVAARLAGSRSRIGDVEVTWRLAQSRGYGLHLVSDPPQYSEWEEKGELHSGLFAYVLRFSVQTQAKSDDPWIHLSVSCRRYAQVVEDFNYGRATTIMVGTRIPRLAGWPVSTTFVPLSLVGSRAQPRWRYNLSGYGLVELLEEIRIDRPLVPPKVFLDALDYYALFHPETDEDEYLVVYSEGMAPNHAMETGFSIVERTRVVKAVTELCQEFLVPDTPQPRDTGMRGKHRPIALLYPEDIDTHPSLHKKLKMSAAQIKAAATQHAMDHQPFHVLLCWESERTRDGLLIALRQLYALGENDPWPEGMHVELRQIPPGLGDPLDPGGLDPQMHFRRRQTPQERAAYKAFKQQWDKQMRRSHQRKVYQWHSWLRTWRAERNGRCFVLIELRVLGRGTHPDQSIHGAVRVACCRLSMNSQMIQPILALPSEMIKPPKEKSKKEKVRPGVQEDRSRAKNAVADLLLRQTGTLYGPPSQVYEWLELPKEIAQSLIVVGLYRRRSTKLDVDYPLAVRLHPDGRVEARLPFSQEWLPYMEATISVGKAFIERVNLQLEKKMLAEFLHMLLIEPTTVPTLMLAFADDWRTEVWPQLANDRMLLDELDFTHIDQSLPRYIPADLPHLRLIRLRDTGNLNETPQYIVTDETAWSEVEDARQIESATGFRDIHTSSPFFHYGSIARRPLTARRQKRESVKHGPGGGEASRYQTIVEIVPFFLQPKDDSLVWCRIPDVLRFSPGWDGGNVLSPYPIHLAQKAVEDQLTILGTEIPRDLDEDD